MGYAEQARLSEQHRAAQTRLQAIVAADTAKTFPLLDANNLDKSFGQYFNGMKQIVNARRTISSSLGARYFTGIRNDADISSVFSPILAGAVNEEQLFTSLLVTGPVSMKKNMANGASAQQARNAALTGTIKANQRHVINGGRETILNSVRRDKGALGWARLTDGKPCAFCALLASRGPAYKTEQTGGFKSHDGCGCTPVPVFDFAAPWPGNAEKYRAAYDQNVSGKFPGGDGNNKAVQAWRKHYDEAFLGGRQVAQVADAVAEVVESSVEWTTAWQAAKAKLPENTSIIGRTGARELTAKEAGDLAIAERKRDEANSWIDRFNAGADRDQLRLDYRAITGEDFVGSYLQVGGARILKEFRQADTEVKRILELRRGAIDITDTKLPGSVANEHLDAILQAGNSIGSELDRRILARLGNTDEGSKALAQTVAKREAVEKQIQDELVKAKAYKETLRIKAIERVDSGKSSLATGTRDEQIEKMLNNILYFDKVNQANIKKIRALTKDQGDILALEKRLGDGIKPGTPQYAQIQREETLKLLSEVRDMGGAGATYTKSGKAIKSGELIAAMDKAHAVYPASWMQRVRTAFPEVDLASTTRGYNQNGTKIRLSKHTVKNLPDDIGYDAVALHELGHSMEIAVDGLTEMEWAYHARRGATKASDGTLKASDPKAMGGIYGRDERAVADEWRELYSGKVYALTPGSSMEVFTTGIESLLTGSRYFANDALGYDQEFRDWVLGVLSVL